MAGNARQFAVGLNRFGDRARSQAVKVINAITLQVYAAIIAAPEHLVDTGRARGSWSISVESPGSFLPPPVEGHQPGDPPVVDPQPAEAFVAMLEGAPLEAKRIIYSNLDYMVWIELGSDTTEGMHVIPIAVQRVIS